jgi:membrane protease YdiL (CAAX protease family)
MQTELIETRETDLALRRTAVALIIATLLPFLLAFTCSVIFSGQRGVIVIYAIGKTLQIAFPLFWVLVIERKSLRLVRVETKGLIAGAIYGLLIVALTLSVYYTLVRGAEPLANVPEMVRYKLGAYGVTGWTDFLWLGLYYAIPHTLVEEYYWRWFVYGRMREFLSVRKAIWISSLAFTLHHILLAHRYLGDSWGFVATFSAGVAVSGMVWAWLYEKTNSLYAAWLSHLIVDAGLIWMAYEFWRS